MSDAIIVENLVKRYGDIEALRGISFKVRKGEIFAFLGPNGAGKTTTINILTTLLKPTSGHAIVAGHDVLKEPKAVRRKIGIVFQEPTYDRELTAYENLYIHGRIYGLKGKELHERILEMLKFVELERFKDKQLKTFSGGMIRRLEIARGLLHLPEILFLDEPTIGLDPQTRSRIWDYIRDVKKEYDMTIFLTTHYMDEAEQLADRISIIDHGKIIAEGSADDLKRLVGSDIIYVKFVNGNVTRDLDLSFAKSWRLLKSGLLEIIVDDASRAIPEIFEKMNKRGLKILEISYRKPSLNDVFIHLTGRNLRDEESYPESYMTQIVRRRFPRKR
ncbi:MAG TPA: ATP-binding cassette domain-containing protein [Thermoprotei archaeon]|nr:ATP-binding cassette domain-containing protein [Thermoprotei archaeon]